MHLRAKASFGLWAKPVRNGRERASTCRLGSAPGKPRPLGPRTALRPAARRRNFHPNASEDPSRREQLPGFQAKRFAKSFDRLDLYLGLFAAFQLLVELEFKADEFGHLFLGKVGSETKIPEILGKSEHRSHRPSYQGKALAYHRMIVPL
jgi:hypothetical protein